MHTWLHLSLFLLFYTHIAYPLYTHTYAYSVYFWPNLPESELIATCATYGLIDMQYEKIIKRSKGLVDPNVFSVEVNSFL